MKCPKCGYNSFETLDTCKKCANDLTSYKDIHGLKAIVIPQEARTLMAEKLMADSTPDDHAAPVETPSDMFSFDIPEDSASSAPASAHDDPFNFDDEPASPDLGAGEFSFNEEQKSAQAKAEEDAFADLLESAPQPISAAPAPAAATELSELDSFSWDDTPDPAPGEATKPTDDFNSLFGETDETAQK